MNTFPRLCAAGCGHQIASQLYPIPGCHQHAGRGLCSTCRTRAERDGTLVDYPRRHYTRDELLTELDWLTGQGFTTRQAAEKLGVTKDAFYQARRRRKRAQARSGS